MAGVQGSTYPDRGWQHNEAVTDTVPSTSTSTAYDVARVRSRFPQLREGAGLGAAHFDGPGGSQTPEVVARAVYDTLVNPLANDDSVTPAERNASRAVVAGRAAMADLLNADPRGVVFGRSMTQLTMDLARTLAQGWGPGDEVVVTRLDHDSNVRSWVIAAERAGATVRWVDFDPETGELDAGAGGRGPDRAHAGRRGHRRLEPDRHPPGHRGDRRPGPRRGRAAARRRRALHGPRGRRRRGARRGHLRVLAVQVPRPALRRARRAAGAPRATAARQAGAGERAIPERFELGTLPYELLAGTAAAVDFLADLVPGAGTRRERLVASYAALEAHEDRLRETIEEALAELPGVTVHSRAARRTPTLLADLRRP